jgi:lysophospholipase L1-like esterase
MNIVYIEGDSTTFGVLDLEMGGWPNRLHVAMLREATNLEDATMVTSRAMLGRTLPAILREADTNMRYYSQFGSVAATLQVGMNESKIFPGSTAPIVPIRLFGEQLVRFCTIARQRNCTPIVVGPPPVNISPDSPTLNDVIIKDELLIEYGDTMRSVANDAGIPYVDTRAVFASSGRPLQELLSPDGYHPNALGHAALAQAVYEALPFRNEPGV